MEQFHASEFRLFMALLWLIHKRLTIDLNIYKKQKETQNASFRTNNIQFSGKFPIGSGLPKLKIKNSSNDILKFSIIFYIEFEVIDRLTKPSVHFKKALAYGWGFGLPAIYFNRTKHSLTLYLEKDRCSVLWNLISVFDYPEGVIPPH